MPWPGSNSPAPAPGERRARPAGFCGCSPSHWGADGGAEIREAVSVLAPGRAVLERARTLYAPAPHGPPEDTVHMLTRAQRTARGCGAAGLCRSVAAPLDGAGEAAPA